MQTRFILDTGGWAELRFSRGDEAITIQFSYLNDAPRLLLEALAALLRGGSEAQVHFLHEPGEAIVSLKRLPGDLIHLKVFRAEDYGVANPDQDEPVFREKLPLSRLAAQVLAEFTQLLQKYGEAGYRERWGLADFPTAAYYDVQALVHPSAARRLPN